MSNVYVARSYVFLGDDGGSWKNETVQSIYFEKPISLISCDFFSSLDQVKWVYYDFPSLTTHDTPSRNTNITAMIERISR